MTMQRMPMTVGQKFDPTNPKHVEKVLTAIDPAQYGTGWKIEHYDQAAGKLYVTRQDAVSSVEAGDRDDEKRVRLGPEHGPGDGEKVAKRFESIPDFAGYVMTHYDSYRAVAHLAKLSPDEVRCRDAVAMVVGAKPWEVRVSKRRGGGFHVGLPKTYTPSKHDIKLDEVITTAVGAPGWYSRIDVPKLTMEIVPSTQPTFPPAIPYPLELAAKVNTQQQLIFGQSLGPNGDEDGKPLSLTFSQGPHSTVNGTTGAGKLLTLDTRIPTPTGWTTMGELEVGMTVLGRDGKPCSVTFLSDIVEEPELYRVTLADGQSILADRDHQWVVQLPADPAATPSAIRNAAVDLRSLASSVDEAHDWSLESLASFILRTVRVPWLSEAEVIAALQFMGISTLSSAGAALIALAERLDFLATEARSLESGEQVLTTGELATREDRGGIRHALPVLGAELTFAGSLHEAGAALASGVSAPARVLRASITQRREVLRGLLDACGAFDNDGEHHLGELPSDAVELVRSLGHRAVINEAGSVSITIGASGDLRNAITSITPIPSQPGRCIQVDSPDSTYLCADFVPTHNTATINALIFGALQTGMELVIVDVPHKAVDYLWCKPFVRDGGWGCESLEHGVASLKLTYEEGERRAATLKRYGVQRVDQLPKHEQYRMPTIFIVIDELSGLLQLTDKMAALPKAHPERVAADRENMLHNLLLGTILKLAAEMRFVGIRLLLSTQVADSTTGIPPKLRTLLSNKILLGVNATEANRGKVFSDPSSVPAIPDNIRADPKAGRGVGAAEMEGVPPTVFKGYFREVPDYEALFVRMGLPQSSAPEPTEEDCQRLMSFLYEDEDGNPIEQLKVEVKRFSGGPLANDPDAGGVDQNGNRLTGAAAAAAASKRHAGV